MTKYKITDNNEVKIWFSNTKAPGIWQKTWPSGEAFTKAEAEKWAEAYVAAVGDTTKPWPGNSRDTPLIHKYTDEEIAEMNAQDLEVEL